MELNTPEQQASRFRARVTAAGIFVLIGFGLIIARFVYLQVIRYEYYSTRAEENRISLVPIVPNRGIIMDRNGSVLARNYSAYTLEITPSKVLNLEDTIHALATLIVDIGMADISLIDYNVSPEEAEAIAANAWDTMGGLFELDPYRLDLTDTASIIRDAFVK